ncbi:hypothetical protein OGAPHI_000164 [Ogataea philodendri]|uniref:AAA+ ATPase domain-containing protein n=1 Tax=Ogataea philodendri TaxID=1378263 RepID=A0A9P8PGT5_9ASCO|nr:uncharacterized protein OGAPHI_000164 [Ogataea philodendri]KAH3671978.1 hypothetical protein OGAPHI_000164 [Ogataea philodendri]
MSLWADKYRPKDLDDLDFHHENTRRLKAMAKTGEFPHILIYGPPGAGKKTRVLATLKQLYGSGVEKLKVDIKSFALPSGRKLEFNVISSPFHLEITPSDMGNNDRIVIQDLLKEIAQVESIDFSKIAHVAAYDEAKDKLIPKKRFKVVVINEAELLTRDAQAALRRTMEKYSANIRLILICNSTSNIIDPIKSRTLPIRIAAPKPAECSQVLDSILAKENHAKKVFPDSLEDRIPIFEKICIASNRNLRMCIMMMEAMYMNNDTIDVTTPALIPDWIEVIKGISVSICKDRSVSQLQQTRSALYELLSHSIPAKLILKRLTLSIWSSLIFLDLPSRSLIQRQIVSASSIFDERLSLGSKDIFHLEGFVTRVMVIIEKELIC